ncbi:MAG: hypothetical protein R3F56_07115 [Planctomycetota bacterium]
MPAGTPFSSRFPPGRFRAEFRGEVNVDVRERYTFVVEGSGEAVLEVNGKTAWQGALAESAPGRSEPLRLKKGANQLLLRYASPDSGDARVRLLWSTSEFRPEPIGPSVLSHEPLSAEDAGARRGHAELLRLQCTACHADDRVPPATAPDLAGVGARLQPGWVYEWLMRPVRAGFAPRQMPHFFADDSEGRRAAADVAAHLATLREGDGGDSVAPSEARQGGALFAQLGCIGCHHRPGDRVVDRTGLDHVASKWFATALVSYLRAPQAHDPGASMPDFRLTAPEAAALAAFLREGAADPTTPPPGDPARGRDLVDALGCAACHALPQARKPSAPPWSAVAARVGDHDLCGGPPAYPPGVDGALLSGLVPVALPLAQAAEESLRRLRCTACHERDGVVDQWTQHSGEVSDLLPAAPADPAHPEVAQTRPSLTWAGEKLRAEALQDVVAGTVEPRARPWLHARMPGFAAHAAPIGAGLSCGHGMLEGVDAPATSDEDVALGATLVTTKMFACVTCHGVGPEPPVQVFEVQGVNFALVGRRLRPEYFLRWMRSPQRVDPGSKMPSYADARGKTAFTDVLGGDAERQFGAIWSWIRSLR